MTQKTAARRMLQSAREIPQFSVSMEMTCDRLTAYRNRINLLIGDKEHKVSVTALLTWITARTLLTYPRLNGQFEQDALIQHDSVNMAIAMDTAAGLTVPVIRRVETLSLCETAEALRQLTARAAAHRLALTDFEDATFTISNLGMFGVTRFIPLVNPPQAAILAVGAPRAVVQLDTTGKPTVVQIIELTVTADHRVTEGAEVARFLRSLLTNAENLAVYGEGDFCPTTGTTL